MVDFSSFKTEAGMPIYLQILYFIERGAVAGSIADGDELPSRRVLSALLGINPNTVQKAFRLLEEEGLIESKSGAKSVMTLDPDKVSQLRVSLLTADIRGLTGALRRTGIDKAEALRLIDRFWDEEAGDEEV
ncbi:MAG: GntR family transcriptional regulator [Firmicutes bacterium]|nr:GntR family transcriptional regulator [Bacillota bacterium]